MKKTVIASLAVLASAALLATFALGGAGKFGDVQVNADTVVSDRSVTFNESNTTFEKVGGDHYAICTTTDNGNKVSVVGYNLHGAGLDFHGTHFEALLLQDYGGELAKDVAYQFSHIIGFKVTFTGNLKSYDRATSEVEDIESGVKYAVSLTPSDGYQFYRDGSDEVHLTSLKVYYSC